MDNYLSALNFVDLISEKHKELRKKVRENWGNSELCDNKLHLISMLKIKKMTISESSKKMNLSKQAVHKFSKSLLEEGIIKIENHESNHKEKLMSLTDKGDMLYNELLVIKQDIEKVIKENIGQDNFKHIKNLLEKKWI